jgi:hypothetical protein
MSQEEYTLGGLSTQLAEGVSQMAEAVSEMNRRFGELPMIVRPFVRRDFKSNMGFSVEEWEEFLRRLAARLEEIRDAAGGSSGELRGAAEPFLERADLVVKKMREFQSYTTESPKKLEMAPKIFLTEEMREQVRAAPEYARQIGRAADGLIRLRDLIRERLGP